MLEERILVLDMGNVQHDLRAVHRLAAIERHISAHSHIAVYVNISRLCLHSEITGGSDFPKAHIAVVDLRVAVCGFDGDISCSRIASSHRLGVLGFHRGHILLRIIDVSVLNPIHPGFIRCIAKPFHSGRLSILGGLDEAEGFHRFPSDRNVSITALPSGVHVPIDLEIAIRGGNVDGRAVEIRRRAECIVASDGERVVAVERTAIHLVCAASDRAIHSEPAAVHSHAVPAIEVLSIEGNEVLSIGGNIALILENIQEWIVRRAKLDRLIPKFRFRLVIAFAKERHECVQDRCGAIVEAPVSILVTAESLEFADITARSICKRNWGRPVERISSERGECIAVWLDIIGWTCDLHGRMRHFRIIHITLIGSPNSIDLVQVSLFRYRQ